MAVSKGKLNAGGLGEEERPIRLGESLMMACSLRPVYLAAIPAAIGLLLLALVQGDLLVGVTYLAQQLLNSFIPAEGTADIGSTEGAKPLLTGWLTGLFSGKDVGAGLIVGGLIFIALMA
jgi:hypothetical protein